MAEFLGEGFEIFLPEETLSAIQDGTGGNPFFLDELARRFVADRQLREVPGSGREFSFDLLVAASGLARDPVLATLGRLAALRLVHPGGFGLGPYRFAHALVRETVYQDLPAHERWRLHRRVGHAIETLHAPDLDRHLDHLAHHFSQAAALGELDRAIEYPQQAGERATHQFGYDEAIGHY